MNIKEKLKFLPQTPGVYIMKDKYKNIIYIGKSKCLKNRVTQYFMPSYAPSKKIVRMVKFIDDIEIVKTDTELDALLLECDLIKKFNPMYNTLLKNNRAYAYLKLNINEKYPLLECSMEKTDNGLYFGPYCHIKKLDNIAKILSNHFKIRQCKGIQILKGCIKGDIGICLEPCRKENIEEYSLAIKKLIDTLNGYNLEIIERLTTKMEKETEKLNFEKALKYKEDIENIKSLINRTRAINFIKNKKFTICSIKIDENLIKLYIFEGIEKIYSKIIAKDNLNLSYLDLKKFNKENLCLIKDDIDLSNIIYNYLNTKSECKFFQADKLDIKQINRLLLKY